jgi:hypothetical protein
MRPTWAQVRQFCMVQGYQERRGDHDRYIKVLASQDTSGTMISHGVDSQTVPSQMWRKVWSQQLRLLNEDELWRGLEGQSVQYDIPPTPEPQQPLPDYLQRHLREVLRWPEDRIATTARDEAQGLLNNWYARELREP